MINTTCRNYNPIPVFIKSLLLYRKDNNKIGINKSWN